MFCPLDGQVLRVTGELTEWVCPDGHRYETFDGTEAELHMTELEAGEEEDDEVPS